MKYLLSRIAISLVGVLFVGSASAGLGGDVASVRRDHQALRAEDVVTSTPLYDVHEARSAEGQRQRQYVNRAGTVFAVTSQGYAMPDVTSLLGSYASRYHEAAQLHRGNHHVLNINDPDLKLSLVRLPRGWQLHSVLPNAMPAGVSREEIR